MSGFNKKVFQKEIDVWVQDQTTAPFFRYFMTEEKDDITLVSPASKDDTVITVSPNHGFVSDTGSILILLGDFYHQTFVKDVTGDAITIETPLPISLPTANVQIIRGSIEMNVNGSITPITFYCRPGVGAKPIDIQFIGIFMLHTSDGDYSTYGGIEALTNGSFARLENSIDLNLGNYKKNNDFIQFGATYTTKSKVGGGQFGTELLFNLKEKYGIVLRLDYKRNEVFKFTINDNLESLSEHRVAATGQITLGE